MKTTDYALRCAPFDAHLRYGTNLVGVEVGVDVGAHAEAMLRHLPIGMLFLIDPWPNPYCRGYCEGRLSALEMRSRFQIIERKSNGSANAFQDDGLDFVYIDQEHDGATAQMELDQWWPKLKATGILGYRNYGDHNAAMKATIDLFVRQRNLKTKPETGEIVLFK